MSCDCIFTDGEDYIEADGLLQLSSAEPEDCADIILVVDNVVERDEQFQFSVAGDDTIIDFKQHTTTITVTDSSSKYRLDLYIMLQHSTSILHCLYGLRVPEFKRECSNLL